MFDKFRDACGVFGIYGHTEASKMAYLGLYALQHRGKRAPASHPPMALECASCARWATSTTSSTRRSWPR